MSVTCYKYMVYLPKKIKVKPYKSKTDKVIVYFTDDTLEKIFDIYNIKYEKMK